MVIDRDELIGFVDSLPAMGLFSTDMVIEWILQWFEFPEEKVRFLMIELAYRIMEFPENGLIYNPLKMPCAPTYHCKTWREAVRRSLI